MTNKNPAMLRILQHRYFIYIKRFITSWSSCNMSACICVFFVRVVINFKSLIKKVKCYNNRRIFLTYDLVCFCVSKTLLKKFKIFYLL